jgi:hypothetical protein
MRVTTDDAVFTELAFEDRVSSKFEATGATDPCRWDVIVGALPFGLSLDPGGEIGGQAERSGRFGFTIRATDALGQVATRPYAGSVYAVPRPTPADLPYTLSCIYMPKPAAPAWQLAELWCMNEKNNTKAAHGQRMPLLGFYRGDDPEVLDWQIKMAVDRGIGCFITGDYWIEGIRTPFGTTTIDALLRARYSTSIAFALTLPHVLTRDAMPASQRRVLLEDVLPYYVATYFSRPSYMRIDGRPVLHVQHWLSAFRTSDPPAIRQVLLDADAVIASLSNDLGAYWMTADLGGPNVDFSAAAAAGFDAVHPYNGARYLWPGGEPWPLPAADPEGNAPFVPGLPYTEYTQGVTDLHKEAFGQADRTGLKFVSAASTCFDYRYLWFAPQQLYYAGDDVALYRAMLDEVRAQAELHPGALPICSNTGKPLIGLGPWNETMESGVIEPGWSQFNASGGGQGRDDPYLLADTAAAAFGQTVRARQYFPRDYTGPWPQGRTEWTFSTATGAGLDEWTAVNHAELSLGRDDLRDCLVARGQFGAGGWIRVQTGVRTALAPYSRLKVLFAASSFVTTPPRNIVGLHFPSSNYSEGAHLFGAPQEPHGRFWGGVPMAFPVPAGQEGFWIADFEIPATARPLTTRMIELRFGGEHLLATYPGVEVWVAIKRVWFE